MSEPHEVLRPVLEGDGGIPLSGLPSKIFPGA